MVKRNVPMTQQALIKPYSDRKRRNVNTFHGTDMTIADSVGRGGSNIENTKFIVGSFGLDCILLTEPVFRMCDEIDVGVTLLI